MSDLLIGLFTVGGIVGILAVIISISLGTSYLIERRYKKRSN
jgi:hypothetical protein